LDLGLQFAAFPESTPGYADAPWGISSARDLAAVRL
jgi:hypothetical protein